MIWIIVIMLVIFIIGLAIGAINERRLWTRPNMDGIVQYHNGNPYVVTKLGIPRYGGDL